MFLGKAIFRDSFLGSREYFTRKDFRFIIWYRIRSNPGKKNKRIYNRQIRNGKNKLRELKNSQWKKLKCCDLYNWC